MPEDASDPLQDPVRLSAVEQTGRFDAASEEVIDRYGQIVCHQLGVPISTVSVIQEDRHLFKSCVGLAESEAPDREMLLSGSIYKHVVSRGEPLVIEDACGHPLIEGDNALVEEYDVVAYLGVPLFTPEGYALGSLCAIDNEPRNWSAEDVAFMEAMAKAVMSEIQTTSHVDEMYSRLDPKALLGPIVEGALDGVLVLEPTYEDGEIEDFICRLANERAVQLLGYPKEELLGKQLYDYFGVPRSEGHFEEYLRVMETGEVYRGEAHYDREEIQGWFDVTISRWENGVIVGFHEITNHKDTKKRLEELHEQRQLALESAQLGTWDYDFEEDTLYWDERSRSIFGVSEGEKIDFPKAIDIIHPDDQGRVNQAVERSLDPADSESNDYEEEYRVVWPDGTVRWVIAKGRSYFESEGEDYRATRFIGTVKDITERKRLEQDLRTAREEAEAANRAKSQFLANMSHELRTPLNAVIGYSEMIREDMVEADSADEKQEQLITDLGQIHTAGEQLLNLVNDVLDIAKIEAGEMQLHPTSFEVAEVTRSTAETIRPLIEENGNVFEVDCPEDIGTMHVDKTKLRQALFNLLSNAAKFTEGGEVTLWVRRGETGGREEMHFAVEDTGIGLSEEEQAAIFESFEQADTTLTREHEGTGLGLTITQNLCEMMGGELKLESEKGEGSTFTIRLPVQMERRRGTREPENGKASPKKVDAQAESPPSWEPAESSSEAEDVVLVIDDDPQTREIIRRRLEKEGFAVASAASGEEGLEAARELRPVAITLDVMMPEMDGWAVLSELQNDEELRDIPVVMVTIVEDEDMGYMLGASDYLTKPLNAERLVSVLQKYYSDATGCSVMIVEDDEAMRDLARRALEKEGCAVRVAENGRIGLEMLKEEPDYRPDAIVLDLMMPEMDGFSFLERVRASEDFGHTPVVVITAKELTHGDRERLNGGVVSILQKGDYDRENLVDKVYRRVAAASAA